jgi:hypothetical protein
MSIVLVGSTSGSVTLQEPAVAGTTVIDLPATSGTMVVTSGAQTIEFADGSAAAPSITNSGDTNTGIFFPSSDTIAFTEGGTESMRIDSNGNVGIGTTSQTVPLQVTRNSQAILLALGSAGTHASGTIGTVTHSLTIGRSVINVPANTVTNLVGGYGGNMLLISLTAASGVADIQYTFVVTGGWNSATVLFSNSYGVNTATFTFSANSGTTRVSHNHSGAINFTVHALTGPGPA